MMRNFITILLSLLSFSVSSQDLECEGADLTIVKTGKWESTRYQLIATVGDRKTELWLNSIDHINSQCVRDQKNRDMILINAYCGGSGCSEHNYIIINAKTLMVELVPVMRNSNLAQAQKILGQGIVK